MVRIGSASGFQICLPAHDLAEAEGNDDGNDAISRDDRRAPATIRALVMPQKLVSCHT
jgi:hypothetical protein